MRAEAGQANGELRIRKFSFRAGDGAILGTGPELTNCKFREVRVSFWDERGVEEGASWEEAQEGCTGDARGFDGELAIGRVEEFPIYWAQLFVNSLSPLLLRVSKKKKGKGKETISMTIRAARTRLFIYFYPIATILNGCPKINARFELNIKEGF